MALGAPRPLRGQCAKAAVNKKGRIERDVHGCQGHWDIAPRLSNWEANV
jgi:hypothetical protein